MPSVFFCENVKVIMAIFSQKKKAANGYYLTQKFYDEKNIGLSLIQLFEPETCTYTYLLADPETKEAIIIDPVLETVRRDSEVVNDLELNLIYGRK